MFTMQQRMMMRTAEDAMPALSGLRLLSTNGRSVANAYCDVGQINRPTSHQAKELRHLYVVLSAWSNLLAMPKN